MTTVDIAIVGGGIVGLAAAVLMRQRGYEVALIDGRALSVDPNEVSPRVYAINQTSADLLKEAGAWPLMNSERMSVYQHMHVWDATNGAQIDFDARMIASDRLGTIIDETTLKAGLLEQAQRLEVLLFPDSPLDEIHEKEEGIELVFGEQHVFARLAMIADGALSKTRDLLGVELVTRAYRHEAIVATVQVEKPHRHTANQVFNPDGPLAFLPLPSDQECSIVWSTTEARAEALMQLDDKAFNVELTQAFGCKLGECVVQGQRYRFPLYMRHVKQYAGNHWLLMGDAAHTIHPLAGQGLNLGLADVGAWCELVDKKNGLWSRNDLKRYQRNRKNAVWQMILLMDGLKAAFTNSFLSVRAIRGLGMRLFNRSGLIKRMMIRYSAGD